MIRSGTVARLTCDVDLGVSGGVRAGAQIVVLAQVGRMAVSTHVIPSLIDTGPVQWIRRRDFLAWIEKEPVLSAALPRTTVPCDSKRLHASARHCNQILLEWRDAKCVFDFVILKGSVRTIGTHHELGVPPKEARSDPVVVEAVIIEIA